MHFRQLIRGRITLLLPLFLLVGCSHFSGQVDPAEIAAATQAPASENFQHSPVSQRPSRPLASAIHQPTIPDSLLDRVISQFGWDDESAHPAVASWVQRYQQQPAEFIAILERAEPFIYQAAQELEQRGMPMELVFLPFVESGFLPDARSWSGASGLWQFMPATGKAMGLEQNWWLDERRDPSASSAAAADYLNYLHQSFGDWYLALAAYNAGEGTIRNAMRLSNLENASFWDLRLNSETQSYLPKLLAVVHLLKNAAANEIPLPHWQDEPFFKTIAVNRQLDLEVVASYLDADSSFYKLNAHHLHQVTQPDGESRVLVPLNLAEKFTIALNDPQILPDVAWQHYKVRSGDNLGLIANRNGVTVRGIMEANKLASTTIFPGDDLFIPLRAGQNAAVDRPASISNMQVVVKSGDSLWLVANRAQTTVRKLIELNQLDENGYLYPGQILLLPQGSVPSDRVEHEVRSGDSLYDIANLYGVRIEDIRAWNALGNSSLIRPGERLTIWLQQDS